MERRKVLVSIAALLALAGAALVFLYVRGAEARAQDGYDTTKVLVVESAVSPGETLESAVSAGKVVATEVTNNSVLPDAQSDPTALAGQVALTTIFPGEQIIAAKFGTTAAPSSGLQVPADHVAVSVNLTDPARVAGFVSPGSEVGIYMLGVDPDSAGPFAQVLLDKVTVIGVGSTTPVSTTTTDESGSQTTEQLPRTLLTLALPPEDAQKVLFAQTNGELSFVLLPADGSTTIKRGQATSYDNLFK